MHPIAFNIPVFWGGGGTVIPIHWYGVLVAAGFLAGLWTASCRARQDGFTPENVMDAGPYIILGAIAGARVLYVISYWNEQFAHQPWTEVFMVQKGGLVFYGGLIGAVLCTLVYLWFKKLPVWKFADALAPSIALGYFFGRFGCLMNGCCYGRPTTLPWAIHFPSDHPTCPNGVHPTQVYEALLNLALYAGLAWLYRRKKFDGQVFAAYLLCYPVLRSLVELFRGDYPVRYFANWVTPAQLVSLAIFAAGLILFWKLRRSAPKR